MTRMSQVVKRHYIVYARKDMDRTQEEFAAILGIGVKNFRALERGLRDFRDIEELRKIAEALNLSEWSAKEKESNYRSRRAHARQMAREA